MFTRRKQGGIEMVIQNLKIMREKKGLRVKEVSNKLKISRITLWQWENGKRTPSIENLAELAKLYDCTIDDLVGDKKDV